MSGCKTLVRTSLSIRECRHRISSRINFSSTPLPQSLSSFSHLSPLSVNSISFHGVQFRSFVSMQGALPIESSPDLESISALEPPDTPPQDTVEHLLTNPDDVPRLMKMERKPLHFDESKHPLRQNRWFPYLDKFRCETEYLNSGEVLDAIGPSILDTRKERFKNAVKNRSYSVCLVVEGLCDFGNVSAAFRSADALGIQSVHVVSCDSSKRYRENRHVSMGAEKWLDIELWDSTSDCFKELKSRGYRVATTHLGMDAVSVYDMDWSFPTAIVVGNENKGISDEALELSDLHCIIPMKGMVDSFNVSVAAGIVMHQAVCDRNSRLGSHGDLTLEEHQILLAEFHLRHNHNAVRIAREYARMKTIAPVPKM